MRPLALSMRETIMRVLRAALVPGVLAVFIAVAHCSQLPPDPLPASAPATSFSAHRAYRHVEVLAAAPRPIGTARHAEARRYIEQQLAALNVEPRTRDGLARKGSVLAQVSNITARLAGTPAGAGRAGTLAIVAHYDSVPTGPGAGDDAASVAAMLETLRALRAGPPLRNDVVFVFTDAEEINVFGATQVDQASFDVVLNFEARGNRGPSLMFETGRRNAGVVRHFAALARPAGGSAYVEAYRRMPNNTDFTVFRDERQGLNFAFIDGYLSYHAATDDPAHLSLASLQHHGDNMLELARSFGDANLSERPDGDAVFFDVLGRAVIRYPVSWALPTSLLLLAAALGGTWLAVRRRGASLRGVLLGAAAVVLGPIAGAVVAAAAWAGLRQLNAAHRLLQEHPHDDEIVLLAIAFLVAAALTAAMLPFRRHHRTGELLCGAALACALAGALVAWLVPGASYLFVVPALFSAAGAAIALAREDRRWSWWAPAVAAVSVLLYVPLAVSLNHALTLGLVPVTGAVLGIIGGVVLPHVIVLRRRWIVPAGLAAAGVMLGLVSAWSATIDAESRRSNGIAYLWDEDTQTASFASAAAAADEWTRLGLGDRPRRTMLDGWLPGTTSLLVAPAPKLEVDVPRIAAGVDVDGARRFEIALEHPVERLELTLTGAVGTVDVDGVSLGATRQIRYWAPPGRVVVRAAGGGPETRLIVRVLRYRLPPGAMPPRPEHLMPTPFGFGWPDLTVVGVSAPRKQE